VIPAHYGNILINGQIDPNIAPQYRGQDQEFPVTDNKELCFFLNNLVDQGLVEICLHGYNHNYPEFKTNDEAIIRQKLTEGRRILEATFPKAPINTFLIPYDAISSTALDLILDSGYHTCIDPRNIPAESSLKETPFYRVRAMDNGTKMVTTGSAGYDYNISDWRETVQDDAATLVILNHYYMFYSNFGDLRETMLNGWREAARQFLKQYSAHVTTFSDAKPDNGDGGGGSGTDQDSAVQNQAIVVIDEISEANTPAQSDVVNRTDEINNDSN
jgi:predicted deacetylase